MKANEFVKKCGVEAAKALLVESTGCSLYVDMNYKATIYQHGDKPSNCDEIDFIVHRDDLKRLVESHESVEECGGLQKVKEHLKQGNVYRFEEKPLMRQAIADVESCQ